MNSCLFIISCYEFLPVVKSCCKLVFINAFHSTDTGKYSIFSMAGTDFTLLPEFSLHSFSVSQQKKN